MMLEATTANKRTDIFLIRQYLSFDLTLIVLIIATADNTLKYIVRFFRLTFHDSHEMSSLIIPMLFSLPEQSSG